ncbi:coproporphyrinogen III oxidase [Poriferisphaera corsica]|uniref:Coproporphyrinogen III oxidase n=1 Tax=Poriferisphaera corsica TaxID=2528020 RepID=A0A517YUX3_9BACT|nr:TIGR01212 family radical SAM protein [Poriferisphaera corsica]QDU34000.1 coproporphyrinogen III oxidase [Poriferisphaera corsica]
MAITEKPYLDFRSYLHSRYGKVLYRVPIDLGFGCPNRNADGSGGCAFCPVDGSRAKQTLGLDTIDEQIRKSIAFASERYGAEGFVAYFQAYTTTFASLEMQKHSYNYVLNKFPFEAIFIGTRPDCLSPKVLDYLAELNHTLDVWVELGVQTTHDSTLKQINRGHDWASSLAMIDQLKARGIRVAAHVILGLPGEDAHMINQTAVRLAQSSIDAIKLHNLHILKNTRFEQDYKQGHIQVMHPFEYGEHVIDFLRRTPSNRPILRLLTDSNDSDLIAPRWDISKGQFIEWIMTQMERRGVKQGDLCHIDVPGEGAVQSDICAGKQGLMIGSCHADAFQWFAQIKPIAWAVWDDAKSQVDLLRVRNADQHLRPVFGDPRWTSINLDHTSQYDVAVWNTNAVSHDVTRYTKDFIHRVVQRLASSGFCVVPTRDKAVLSTFASLGFEITPIQFDGIYGFIARQIKRGLFSEPQKAIAPKYKIEPYRDPNLCLPHRRILQSREEMIREGKNMHVI